MLKIQIFWNSQHNVQINVSSMRYFVYYVYSYMRWAYLQGLCTELCSVRNKRSLSSYEYFTLLG